MVTTRLTSPPGAVISLTRFGESTALVCETLESLAALRGSGLCVYLFDQKPDGVLEEAVAALSTARLPMHYRTIPARSLSYARNAALAVAAKAGTEIVLYIDADGLADPGWAEALCKAFDEVPEAGLVGARIEPRWRVPPPLLARARFVRDQFSVLDLGVGRKAYHRVVGAGFGLHLGRLAAVARFDETLGRREGRLFSGEETELCARAQADGWEVLYEGSALVHHQILPERARTRWILRRFYYAGWSRAAVGGTPSPSSSPKGAEWLAMALVLVPYAYGYLMGLLTRKTFQTNP